MAQVSTLPDKGCLHHTICLSHLLAKGSDTPWQKFQILGLSNRDNQVYLMAVNEYEIDIFIGNPLIPNSWTMKHKFVPPGNARIDTGSNDFTSYFCKAFSGDFSQIGLVVTVFTNEDMINHVTLHHIFAVLDLNTSHWEHRMFIWPDGLPFFWFSHTSAGWLGYDGENVDLTVYQLSLDRNRSCVMSLTNPPPQIDPNELYDDDSESYVFASWDSLYFFPRYTDERRELQTFMVVCHLNREGFPWVRYDFGSTIHQGSMWSGLHATSWGSLPLIKTKICRCLNRWKLNCADCKERESDPAFMSVYLHKIHTFELDSITKFCHLHKFTQFWDIPGLVGLLGSISLTSSNLLSLLHSKSQLILHTVAFRNPPSLKEISLAVVIEKLCNKSQFTMYDEKQKKNITLFALCGGPSEQTIKKLLTCAHDSRKGFRN